MTPEQFMANFGAIAEAPEGVKNLRELVLRLAVEGALSEPLDEDDDPDVLLRSIREACETTAKDNGWRFKSLPEREEPFCRAPSRWPCESLGNLGVALGGGTPSKQRHEFWEGDIPWVSPKDMKRDVIDDSIDHVSELAVESSAAKLIDAPALLMVLRGMILAHSFPVAITSRSVTINQDLKALVLGDPRTAPYLLLAMKAAKNAVLSLVETSSHGTCRLSAAAVLRLGVPVPPVAEQKRIVAKVEQLMAMLDDLEQRQEKKRTVAIHISKASLDSLVDAEDPDQLARAWERVARNFEVVTGSDEGRQALRFTVGELACSGRLVATDESDEPVEELLARLKEHRAGQSVRPPAPDPLDANETPYLLPSGWRWSRIGELLLLSEAGKSPQCEKRPRKDDEYGVLKVSAVSWGAFNSNENKALPPGLAPFLESEVRDGDYLLSRANTAELVARSVVAQNPQKRLLMSDKLVRLTFGDSIDPRFFSLYNNGPHARAYYMAHASGTSSSMKNVSRKVIINLPVPVPPLAEQKRIISKVDNLTVMLDELGARSTDLNLASERLAAAIAT